MKIVRIQPRSELEASEITNEAFDDPSAPKLRGLIYREATRTVRLMTVNELQKMFAKERGLLPDTDDEEIEDISEPIIEERRQQTSRASNYNKTGELSRLSFYGIGCWVILKNGVANEILGPKLLEEKYQKSPPSS